jgi:hypothetical protein
MTNSDGKALLCDEALDYEVEIAELAEKIRKEWTQEETIQFSATAFFSTAIRDAAFEDLLEKYQIRERFFSEKLRERDQLYKTKLLEIKEIYDDLIRQNHKNFSAESQNGISEANQRADAIRLELKNDISKIVEEEAKFLIENAYIAGQKEAGTIRAIQNTDTQYAPNRAAKKYVQEAWATDQAEYRSKADFSRIYSKLVKKQFDVKVSPTWIADEWLKNSPSAS